MLKRLAITILTLALILPFASLTRAVDEPVPLHFYYPAKPDAPLAKIITEFVDEFNSDHENIEVLVHFAGDYPDIYKALAAENNAERPDVAVMLATDTISLIDNDQIVGLNDVLGDKDAVAAYTKDFFPAFLLNAQAYDKLWGAPFQRSTQVLYYNKALFKAAGLDPDKAPETQQELVDYAKKLTKSDGSQWGLEIPSAGFPYWFFQGFAISNGQNIVGDETNKVHFNDEPVVKALDFVASLSNEHKVMPKGQLAFGDVLNDFNSGKAAMIYHTSGSLTGILNNTRDKFEVGVAFLPKGAKGYGAPTGGSNLVIFKHTTTVEQAAAWQLIDFLTSAEIQARWTVATGYVAARQSAWETDTLKDFIQKNPLYAVAKDQLPYAGKEFSVHQNAEIQKIFNTAFFAATSGESSAQAALDAAQKDADAIVAQYEDAPLKSD
jgi:sn-glycerol 3-phosphate transport system substrate-binding protein